ncbi:MAG: hypothetical protein R2865_12885 [Deinococcales bacterium]
MEAAKAELDSFPQGISGISLAGLEDKGLETMSAKHMRQRVQGIETRLAELGPSTIEPNKPMI